MRDADHRRLGHAGAARWRAFSRSIELIHSPPDLITSLERSVMHHRSRRSRSWQTSPVWNQPSGSRTGSCRRPSCRRLHDPRTAHHHVARDALPSLRQVVTGYRRRSSSRTPNTGRPLVLAVMAKRSASPARPRSPLGLKRVTRCRAGSSRSCPSPGRLRRRSSFTEALDHGERARPSRRSGCLLDVTAA